MNRVQDSRSEVTRRTSRTGETRTPRTDVGLRTSFLEGRLGACVETLDDSPTREIVRRELNGHPISRKNPDAVYPHAPRDVREDFVPTFRFNAKRRVGEVLFHDPRELDRVFGHSTILLRLEKLLRESPQHFLGISRSVQPEQTQGRAEQDHRRVPSEHTQA